MYTYIIPKTLDQVQHVIKSTSTYAHGDTLKRYTDFRDEANAVHRLSYGDKPIRIYQKWPLFENSSRYLGENPIKLKDQVLNSDVKRYGWHDTEECANNDIFELFGPIFWPMRNCTTDTLSYQFSVYMQFKELDVIGL